MRRKFSFFVRAFLKWAAQCLKPSTVAVYRHYFRGFLRHHGDLTLQRLTPSTLTAWAKTWHASQALKRLFAWCWQDAGLISSNPFQRCKNPPKGMRRRILTPKEWRTIYRASSPDFRVLLELHRETFARPIELRQARFEDLRPNDSPATLRRALLTGKATIVLIDYKCRTARREPNAPRVILLSPRAGKLIAQQRRGKEDMTGPILRTAAGRAWTANAVRCRFRRLRARLTLRRDDRGENIVPYTFRHTGATAAAAAGVRDRVLADVLGHTETSTTARYQHLCVEHLQLALRCLWDRQRTLQRRRSNGESGR